MILVIKKGNGESYEDYQENIEVIFQINKKGLTSEKVKRSYKDHIIQLCENKGIVVNPHWLDLMEAKQQPQGKITREMRKSHSLILKENTIIDFVKKNYRYKQLNDIHETVY